MIHAVGHDFKRVGVMLGDVRQSRGGLRDGEIDVAGVTGDNPFRHIDAPPICVLNWAGAGVRL